MIDPGRRQLAVEQDRLVRSLHGDAPPPVGFDPGRIQTAAKALLRKRRRGVERNWPELARAAGHEFSREFADYARANALPGSGGSREDASRFARHLARRGLLPRRFRFAILLRRVATIFYPRRRG